jgi:type III secretory pathway component EscT
LVKRFPPAINATEISTALEPTIKVSIGVVMAMLIAVMIWQQRLARQLDERR